jgi:hypothetical protein
MKLPRLRFTVRWAMGVVAMTAAVLGSLDYLKRRSDRLWAIHLEQAALARECLDSLGKMNLRRRSDRAIWMGPLERFEYHKRLSMKYFSAAGRPWLPVAPDPPEPR